MIKGVGESLFDWEDYRPFEYNGVIYNTIIGAFYSNRRDEFKTRFPKYSAGHVKSVIEGLLKQPGHKSLAWEKNKHDYMLSVVKSKMEAYPEMKTQLKSMPENIVFITKDDAYWGVVNSFGSNTYGKALMLIRDGNGTYADYLVESGDMDGVTKEKR